MAEINLNITLSHDEVNQKIPYALICDVRYGSRWNTGKNKREYEKSFTVEEREEAEKIFRQAYKWHITSGVPDNVTMSMRTFALWLKLGEFCAR